MKRSAPLQNSFVPEIHDLSYTFHHFGLVRLTNQGYARSGGHPP